MQRGQGACSSKIAGEIERHPTMPEAAKTPPLADGIHDLSDKKLCRLGLVSGKVIQRGRMGQSPVRPFVLLSFPSGSNFAEPWVKF
jgi:hypothetical protein